MVDWYNSSWTYRRKITISGQNINGNHTDFPWAFVVSTLDADLSSNAHSGGKDFVFTTSDGTTRTHCEIENWLYGSGTVWVRAPVLSDGTNAVFYLYYGEGSDHTNDAGYKPSGVWDADFLMVHHLNDVTTSTVLDSTTNDRDGAKHGANSPVEVNGKVGKAQKFLASNGDYIVISDDLEVTSTDFTIECWITTDTVASGYNPWVQKQNGDGTGRTMIERSTDDAHTSFGGSHDWRSNCFATDTWYHVVMAYDDSGDDTTWYFNGKFDETQSNIGAEAANGGWVLGGWKAPTASLNGKIDEMRISTIMRDADWVKTSYSSMNSPSTFFFIGEEEENEPVAPSEVVELELYNDTSSYGREMYSGSDEYDLEMFNSPGGY